MAGDQVGWAPENVAAVMLEQLELLISEHDACGCAIESESLCSQCFRYFEVRKILLEPFE